MKPEITLDDITPFCAGCGGHLATETWGLCEECEDKIQQADTAWKPNQEDITK